MAQSENNNSKEKKEWVDPEFLTEEIKKTESGLSGGGVEDFYYGS